MNKAKIIFISAIIFFGFFAMPKSSQAATYYVDYGNGSDTNNGTATTTAWQHCPGDVNATGNVTSKTLAGGDTVIFKGGVVYKGTVKLNWSGTTGNPITYDGNSADNWGSDKAIIDGEGDTLNINARSYGFYSAAQSSLGKSYLVINNFEIRNLRYIFEDTSTNQPRGIYIDGAGTDVEIKNCNLHDIKKKALGIDTEQGALSLTTDTFSDAGQDFTPYVGVPGQLATHKIMISWILSGQTQRSDYWRTYGYIGELNGSNNSIKVYQDIYMTTPGWHVLGYDPLAVGNHDYFYWVYDLEQGSHCENGGYGISVVGHSNVLIHDNSVKHAKGGIAVNAAQGNPSDNVQVYNNDISLVSWGINPTAGGYAGQDMTNLAIYNNRIHDFFDYVEYDWGYHRDGVFLFNSGPTDDSGIIGVNFYNNFFYGGIGPSTALLYMSGNVSQVKIYNNLFASSSGAGYQIRTIGDSGLASVHDLYIYNNVFAKIPGEDKVSLNFRESANIHLKNNIFYLFESYGADFNVESTAISGFASDYNLLTSARLNSGGDVYFNTTPYTLENWRNLGFDTHSVLRQAPLFNNFPTFAAKAKSDGTTTRFYFTANTNPNYDHTFVTGDHVEYDYDGIMRTITAVGSDYIDIDPALTSISKTGKEIVDWKNAANFIYDLSLKNNSPAINAGTNLTSLGITALNTDKDGVTRPASGAWDIGAYEYVSGDTTPPVAPSGLSVQ